MMKEIPILFRTEMVKAIIEGRKTMTRRICKDNADNLIGYEYVTNSQTYPEFWKGKKSKPYTGWIAKFNDLVIAMPRKCPYGKVGDILYVRENWKMIGWDFEDDEATIEYTTGEKVSLPLYSEVVDEKAINWLVKKFEKLVACGYYMPSQDSGVDKDPVFEKTDKVQPFSPSIHLPKWGSRIWLEIVSVKAERIQDISEDDSLSEGVEKNCHGDISLCSSSYCKDKGCQASEEFFHYMRGVDDFPAYSAKESFESLWEKINRRESWESNPWVWVIQFKVLSTTGKP